MTEDRYETVKELTVTGAITDAEYALLFRFIADAIDTVLLGDALVLSVRRAPLRLGTDR